MRVSNQQVESLIQAKTTVSYEALLLDLLQKAFEIRRKLAYTLHGRKNPKTLDYYTLVDYYEMAKTLHIALEPHLRTQELEEQIRSIRELYKTCKKSQSEDHEDKICVMELALKIDKYLETYLTVLDQHNLLLRKQSILVGGEK